jgi:hypothetical protein
LGFNQQCAPGGFIKITPAFGLRAFDLIGIFMSVLLNPARVAIKSYE